MAALLLEPVQYLAMGSSAQAQVKCIKNMIPKQNIVLFQKASFQFYVKTATINDFIHIFYQDQIKRL